MTVWVIFHSSASNSAWSRLRVPSRSRQKSTARLSPGAGPREAALVTGPPAAGNAVSAGDAAAGGKLNGAYGPDADAPAIACQATRISAPTTAPATRTIHSSGARTNLRM